MAVAASSPEQVPLSVSPNTATDLISQPACAASDSAEVSETKPQIAEALEDFDIAYYNKKHTKYEVDYTRRLKAKYFSKKNLYGGNIFDKEVTIDNETVKSSRWPCTRSFTDPVRSFEDHSKSSNSVAETSHNLANRKYQCKKNSS